VLTQTHAKGLYELVLVLVLVNQRANGANEFPSFQKPESHNLKARTMGCGHT
jgi:hypothetical protein